MIELEEVMFYTNSNIEPNKLKTNRNEHSVLQ